MEVDTYRRQQSIPKHPEKLKTLN